MELEPVLIIVTALAGLGSSVFAELITKRRNPTSGGGETTEARVTRLTRSLTEASKLITEIEREIQKRTQLATTLQEQVNTYNELAALRKSEVEAVAQALRGELRNEGKRSFWQGFAMNFFFFLLGVVFTVGFEYFRG